jgi:hypothetical protein
VSNYNNTEKNNENIFSDKIKAGNKRTYFFDVKSNKNNDYFITITESRKRQHEDGYDRSKIFIYKEDFNKFCKSLTQAVDFVKTELMPNFDFNSFNHDTYSIGQEHNTNLSSSRENIVVTTSNEDVDKW